MSRGLGDVYKRQDVVRHPLVQKIVQAYDDYENKQTAKTARKQRKSN